ncbi:sigma-70 family RNA polymerase sigma factor [Bacillus sp. FJAT-49736]|uniref:sigma-70 family RNA polymerase sigma factor n=1 Tax=Bacillus sp. FJAT-49736 TaxID=2833582 RepID=UPI001BCA1895|nr:sigma-70 family RNA polymerase sigma factor [Bacillus sp. FJAT-49736]MBS4173088.1 sigma-70 family RNA polymerase sigma factor [Bacillus sp. FJAT-49736]
MKTKLGNESIKHDPIITSKIIHMYPALKRYCQFLTKNGWDAEDLAHEAIEKMYNKYMVEKSNISNALLYRIAHNQWVDQIRKRSKENAELQVEPSIDPLKTLPEVYSISEKLVKKLTPQQTIIFILKDVFQYDMSEIAKQLNLSEGAIKSSLFRTRQHLKRIANEDESHTPPNQIEAEHHRLLLDYVIHSIQQEQPLILIKQYKKLFSGSIPMCKGTFTLSLLAAA